MPGSVDATFLSLHALRASTPAGLISHLGAVGVPQQRRFLGTSALAGLGNGDADGGPGMLTAVAVAVICGLAASLRRRTFQRTRVARGTSNAKWFNYTFRAKPGDKYRYRFSTDVHTQEWGYWPPEPEGRLLKYGLLLKKGVPQGPRNYLSMKANKEAAKESMRGALLLDCDGTLVETERDGHRVAFNRAFAQKGFDCEWDVNLYGQLLTTAGGKERMARYFTDYNPTAWTYDEPPSQDHPVIKELHELKTKIFMDIVRSAELPLRPGVMKLLTAADAAGWTLAVCSTSNEESVKAVVETMLPSFASSMRVFAGDMVKAKKPDPEIYLMAAKELGLAPMKCVVVEDSNIGMKAGKAAGMQVIVTKSIYSEEEDFDEADLVVRSATEVDFESNVASLLPMLQLS